MEKEMNKPVSPKGGKGAKGTKGARSGKGKGKLMRNVDACPADQSTSILSVDVGPPNTQLAGSLSPEHDSYFRHPSHRYLYTYTYIYFFFAALKRMLFLLF